MPHLEPSPTRGPANAHPKSLGSFLVRLSLVVALVFVLLHALHDAGAAHMSNVRNTNDAQGNRPVYLDFVNDKELTGRLGTSVYRGLKQNTPYIYLAHDGDVHHGSICFQIWHPSPSVEVSAPPVIYFAGLGGSRLEQFIGSGLQDRVIITIDRPGLGLSDRLWTLPPSSPPGARYAEVSFRVSSLLKDIGIHSYSIVGWSSGGPYALNLFHYAPLAVTSVSLVASDPPWGAVPWSTVAASPLHLLLLGLARTTSAPTIGRGVLYAANVATGLVKLLKGSSPSHTTLSFVEGLRGGLASATSIGEEVLAERCPSWASVLGEIDPGERGAIVKIYHSPGDRVVPFASATFLQRSVKGATLVTKEPMSAFTKEEGHYIMRKNWDDIVYER